MGVVSTSPTCKLLASLLARREGAAAVPALADATEHHRARLVVDGHGGRYGTRRRRAGHRRHWRGRGGSRRWRRRATTRRRSHQIEGTRLPPRSPAEEYVGCPCGGGVPGVRRTLVGGVLLR